MPTSKSFLLDVNCWLAAAAQRHAHHSVAKAWLDSAFGPLFFCRVTQMAFLRLITNPKVMGDEVLRPEQAWEVYRKLRCDARIAFAEEPAGTEAEWQGITSKASFSQNLWTDCYLAAFAKMGGYQVVTFDSDFTRFGGAGVIILQSAVRSGPAL